MSHAERLRAFPRRLNGDFVPALVLACSLLFSACVEADPQGAQALPQRVYVGELAKGGDSDLRKELIKELGRSKSFQIVRSRADADAVLAGTTELYVRGYYSLYARAGTSPEHGHPLYGGYASVELKSRSGETLWSYLSTLRTATTNPSRALSHDIARHLLQNAAIPKSKAQ